jgi:hypothetical protein
MEKCEGKQKIGLVAGCSPGDAAGRKKKDGGKRISPPSDIVLLIGLRNSPLAGTFLMKRLALAGTFSHSGPNPGADDAASERSELAA